jgi:hypothetical protein
MQGIRWNAILRAACDAGIKERLIFFQVAGEQNSKMKLNEKIVLVASDPNLM